MADNFDILKKAQKTVEKNKKTKLKIDHYEEDELVTGWDRVSTGSLLLDDALGGGWAVGRIHTVYGDKNAGKSTTVQIATAKFQEKFPKKIVIDCDAERSREDSYAARLGVDHDKNKYVKIRPDKAEDFLDYALELLPKGIVSLLIIDSVKALIPKRVYEGQSDDQHMAAQARMLSDNLAMMAQLAADNDTTIIMTNQMRVNIGQMFGNPEHQTGGKSVEYTPSLILKLWSKDDESVIPRNEDENPLGYLGGYYIEKSRFCNPFQKIEVPVIFGEGFDNQIEIVELALKKGIIERASSWFKVMEDGEAIEKEQGKNNMIKRLKEDEALFDFVKDEVKRAGEE